MCVALPARVVAIEPATRTATALVGDSERTVDLSMTPEVEVGDWVISHSGFAVRRVSPDDATALLDMLAEPAG